MVVDRASSQMGEIHRMVWRVVSPAPLCCRRYVECTGYIVKVQWQVLYIISPRSGKCIPNLAEVSVEGKHQYALIVDANDRVPINIDQRTVDHFHHSGT
jgi:hypothetical protein